MPNIIRKHNGLIESSARTDEEWQEEKDQLIADGWKEVDEAAPHTSIVTSEHTDDATEETVG